MKTFKIGSIVRAPDGNEYKVINVWTSATNSDYGYVKVEASRKGDTVENKFFRSKETDALELVREPEKIYKLTETQLLSLLEQAADLECLYCYGVDNWQGYHENMREFCAENGVDVSKDDYDFDDVARIWINEYEEL